MSNLFEISQDYRHLLDMLEEETDDETIKEVIKDSIELLQGDFEAKADNYAYIKKQLEADAEALKKEEQRLKARRESIEKNKQRLMEALMAAMKVTGNTKFKTAYNSFGIRKASIQPVILDCAPENLPDKFQKIKIEADNQALRDYLTALANSEFKTEFPYAHLGEKSEYLSIR